MLQVRKFRSPDEDAVRRICFDTALFGGPICSVFDDSQLVTDLLVGCHIWSEPHSLYVAEMDGQVAGYLAGRMDSRRRYRPCVPRMCGRLARRWAARGHWARPGDWRLAYAAARYGCAVSRMSDRVSDRYPANLHVNINRTHRGAGIGSALVRRFLKDAACNGSPGVHLSTASDAGKQFFPKMGFSVVMRDTTPAVAGEPPREVWLMAQALAADNPLKTESANQDV